MALVCGWTIRDTVTSVLVPGARTHLGPAEARALEISCKYVQKQERLQSQQSLLQPHVDRVCPLDLH